MLTPNAVTSESENSKSPSFGYGRILNQPGPNIGSDGMTAMACVASGSAN